jgi:hypothetical protein
MKVSVVISVLNECGSLPATIAALPDHAHFPNSIAAFAVKLRFLGFQFLAVSAILAIFYGPLPVSLSQTPTPR